MRSYEDGRRDGYSEGSGDAALAGAAAVAVVAVVGAAEARANYKKGLAEGTAIGFQTGTEQAKQKQHEKLSSSPAYRSAVLNAELRLALANKALIAETKDAAIANFTRRMPLFTPHMSQQWRSRFTATLPSQTNPNPDIETLRQLAVEHVTDKSYDTFQAEQFKKIEAEIKTDFNESRRATYAALNRQTESARDTAVNNMRALYTECACKPRALPFFIKARINGCMNLATEAKRKDFFESLDTKLPEPTADSASKAQLMLFGQTEAAKAYPEDAYRTVVAEAKASLK